MEERTERPTLSPALADRLSGANGQTVPPRAGQPDTPPELPEDAELQNDPRPLDKSLGRGLDIGTANLLAAYNKTDGTTVVRRERNMFLEIPAEFQRNKNMLTRLNVPYVSYRNRLFVFGDAAFDLANMFGKEVRRPMKDGFLSAEEQDAIPMMHLIISKLLGKPTTENEPVSFCIPAPSIDTENDTIYHEGVMKGLLRKMGYAPSSVNEAHAIVYSELADQDFTGIGISCGGGMFNVCVAYKTIPAVTFSVGRGGDWIDSHVSKVLGLSKTRAIDIKESDSVDLTGPRGREEEAVVLYYRHLIEYVLRNLAQRFSLAHDVPSFNDPVKIVVAGGTSLVRGFTDIFQEELARIDFPLKVSGVKRSDDPLTSVVRGCLISSALDQE